jgi:hypothetical protein
MTEQDLAFARTKNPAARFEGSIRANEPYRGRGTKKEAAWKGGFVREN